MKGTSAMSGSIRLLATLALGAALTACTVDDGADADDAAEASEQSGMAGPPERLADIGLQTPESVLHDADADVYLVSNINGAPLEHDDNGFISRLTPEGQVVELKWIDGAAANVRLSAPKGMTISGSRLLVTDIDTIRAFDLASGEPIASWGVSGATFLNDLVTGPDGTVYVSDTGMRAGQGGFEPSGSAAVYRLGEDGTSTRIAGGDELLNPNGLAVGPDGLIAVTFGGDRALRLDSAGTVSDMATLPGDQLDGIVRTRGGDLLISSWGASAVYRVDAQGNAESIVDGVQSPADIGYDAQRNRLLIPLFMEDAIVIRDLE